MAIFISVAWEHEELLLQLYYVSNHILPLFHFIVIFINSISLCAVWMWIIIKNSKSGLLLVAFLLPCLFLSYNSDSACFLFYQ